MTERARSKTIQEEPPEHPTDIRDGTWSRLELLQMNARFVVAMERERAFDDPGEVGGAKLVCLERRQRRTLLSAPLRILPKKRKQRNRFIHGQIILRPVPLRPSGCRTARQPIGTF
jgi:hypothetical protein